jgi:uncharacterized protein YkwD
MTWADFVIILILLFFASEGFGKRLLAEMLNLLSFIVGFLLALRFYNLVGERIENLFTLPHSFANVIGFLLIWFTSELLFMLSHIIIYHIFKKIPALPKEELLSMIPAFFRGAIFVSMLLVLVATFPIQSDIKKDIVESKSGSFILSQTNQLEAPLKNIFGNFANDTLTFLTIHPRSDESVNLGFKTDNFTFDDRSEQAMIDLVNQERAAQGLWLLKYDSGLKEVGRLHSADMFKRGYFSHYTPERTDVGDRVESAGINFVVVGENLAFAPSLPIAHQGLMNSPGHRANILSRDYHRIGIGVAVSSKYGMMFTQVFMN